MMEPVMERSLGAEVVSKVTRRLMPFLFLLYIVAYLDRINVGFAALQMQPQLGFADSVYGLGAGMFFAGYFFFQLPSNLMLSRVGVRRWMAALMAAWGVVSCAMIFTTTPRSFYVLRFLLGVTEAGFYPGIILYMKHWFPAANRARALAFFNMAGPLAGVVGGPISGALLGLHNLGGLAGWQWLFLIEGIPAILLGGVVLVFLTDHASEARWLKPEEREWLTTTIEQEKHLADVGSSSIWAAFHDPRVWLLSLVYIGLNTCSYGINLWLPNVIRSVSGVNSFTVGLLAAIPYIGAVIAMLVTSVHSDRTRERRWHVAVAAFTGAAALVIAAYTGAVVPSMIALSLAIMAAWCIPSPFWALATTLLSGTAAAAGIALINSVGNLGGFFGPWIIGWVRTATGGFRGGFLVVAGILALAGVIVLQVRARKAA